MNTFQQVGAVATKTVDRWAWYLAALQNPAEIGKSLKASEDSPQQGYYRSRFKGQAWEPIAIFYPEGSDQLVAYRNNREVRDVNETWVWCLRYPISYEAYQRAIDGGGWADDDPTVAAQIAPAPPGHNSADVSEAEMLRDQIEAAKKGAAAYAKITDDATLGKAQSLRSRLNELSGEADKKREALKRPYFEAGKAIDREWQPLVKSAKEAADGIRNAMSAYETEKLRKAREAEREARQRVEDEAREAEEAGKPLPVPEPVAAPVASAPAAIKGTYGKAASVRAKLVVTGISNPIELFKFVAGDNRIEVLLVRIAQEHVDAGRTVPGVFTEEVAAVR